MKRNLLIIICTAFLILTACTQKVAVVTPTPALTPGGTESPVPTLEPSGAESPKPTETAEAIVTAPAEDPYSLAWWQYKLGNDSILLSVEEINTLNRSNRLRDMSSTLKINSQQLYNAINTYTFPSKTYLNGNKISSTDKNAISENRNIDILQKDKSGKDIEIRYAVVTSNAALRSFPTDKRISDESGRHDYFQETGLNIGEPIFVLHDSKDGNWSYVYASFYEGWVKKENFGLCDKKTYDEYVASRYSTKNLQVVAEKSAPVELKLTKTSEKTKTDTGVRSVYIRMGTYFAALDEEGKLFTFPQRDSEGKLYLSPAEEVKQTDSVLVKQEKVITSRKLLYYAANLLAIPYSWGDENEKGMDCSSTLKALYAVFGLELPRNTSQQICMKVDVKDISALDSAAKTKYISERSVGTILYMPGHVMMVLGEYKGRVYILHNTTVSARDDGKTDEYYACVITAADIGKTGKTLLDRATKLVNLFELN